MNQHIGYARVSTTIRTLTCNGSLGAGRMLDEASPGGAGPNRTFGLRKLMLIEVPLYPLVTQQGFDRLQAKGAALNGKHTAFREANAALFQATLERVFTWTA